MQVYLKDYAAEVHHEAVSTRCAVTLDIDLERMVEGGRVGGREEEGGRKSRGGWEGPRFMYVETTSSPKKYNL